eukprot:PITA_22368
MELQEVDSLLPMAMRWIQHTSHLTYLLQTIPSTDSDTFIVKVDAMELLDWNPQLGKAILNDPDFVAFKLWNFIFPSSLNDGPGFTRGKRMWLRLESVPLPLVSAEKLWKTGAAAAYLRQFRCKGCGFVKDIFLCENFPSGRICCSYGVFEEDTAASIYISSQEVLLGPVPTVSEETLPFPQLITIILRDDLTGQVQVGDSIAVIGHAFTEITQTPSAHERCIGQFKVKANNIVHPFNFNSFTMSSSDIDIWADLIFLDDDGCFSLNALCHFLSGSLSVLSRVALLISLVACENSSNFQDNNWDLQTNNDRRQVHVLLTSANTTETLSRQLQTIAALFAARSVRHSCCNKNLVAKLTNSSSGGHKILQSGSLCRSNDGVFLVDFFSCPISRSEVRELCDAMDKPSICVKDHQDLCIPCRSTIWGSFMPLLNSEVVSSLPSNSLFKPLRKGPVLDRGLISKFDIIVSADELDYEYSPVGVKVDNNNNNATTEYRRGMSSHELEELRKHLHLASTINSVKISKGAQDLILSYYLALRKTKSVMKKSEDVLSLQSLLRVASACARLCLRDEILEVALLLQIPDATMAILLCEGTHAAKWGLSVMPPFSNIHLVSSGGNSERNLDMEIKGFHHDLMQNLMPLQPSCLFNFSDIF